MPAYRSIWLRFKLSALPLLTSSRRPFVASVKSLPFNHLASAVARPSIGVPIAAPFRFVFSLRGNA